MLYALCPKVTKQIPLDEKEIIWHILCNSDLGAAFYVDKQEETKPAERLNL